MSFRPFLAGSIAAVALLTFVASSQAAVIGADPFSYADGPINGKNGGTGWNNNGSGVSSWTSSGPNSTPGSSVTAGALITSSDVGAFRTYASNEAGGAVQSTGILFYKVTLTLGASPADYAGMSSYDNGTERLFFGRTFQGNLGIDGNAGKYLTSYVPQANTSYTFIGVIDFTNHQVAMFVNPDGTDYYNPASALSNSADTSGAYANPSNNWSTQIRLQSGGAGGSVAWDNVTVATAPGDVGLSVPEPSSAVLLSLVGSAVALRRRRQGR